MGAIRKIPIAVAPVFEQRIIASLIESLLGIVSRVEEVQSNLGGQMEDLGQSILAQAFRGELVPTGAELARQEGRTYEPASALLERIKAERKQSKGAKKKQKQKQKQKQKKPPRATPAGQLEMDL